MKVRVSPEFELVVFIMATTSPSSRILHPLDIIAYFVENGGRSTNNQLVRNFKEFLTLPEVSHFNKSQLKAITGHIGVIRKQGSVVPSASEENVGGKVIVLKKIFRGKTAEDIWTSIILSLPPGEVNRLVPQEGIDSVDQSSEKQAGDSKLSPSDMLNSGARSRSGVYLPNPEDNLLEPSPHGSGNDVKIEGPLCSQESIDSEKSTSKTDSKKAHQDVVYLKNNPSLEQSKQENLTPQLNIKIEITPATKEATNTKDARKNMIKADEKEIGEKDNIYAENPKVGDLKSSDMKTRTSVRDLANVFNENASLSSTSLADHVKILPGNKDRNRRHQRNNNNNRDNFAPLGASGHAWLMAGSRCDYHTLVRLAKQEEALVDVRDPASGYTALHWACKHGNDDVIKLLVGTYGQDPNVRSRGGYTPLMLAGLFKRHSSYNLLLESYKADEELRDFSGRTSYQYLELHHMEIPGIPMPVEMSHDQSKFDLESRDNIDGHKKTVKVARSKTHYFVKEGIRGLRDSMRISSSKIKEELRPRTLSMGQHEDVTI